jgi:Uma2 family endonuclease
MLAEHIFTYREYLENKPELEFSYELVAGKIVPMPPESFINVNIALVHVGNPCSITIDLNQIFH